jgi:hypothetical protein
MANKQQRRKREAKKPKKAKLRPTQPSTGVGIVDKAREWPTGDR